MHFCAKCAEQNKMRTMSVLNVAFSLFFHFFRLARSRKAREKFIGNLAPFDGRWTLFSDAMRKRVTSFPFRFFFLRISNDWTFILHLTFTSLINVHSKLTEHENENSFYLFIDINLMETRPLTIKYLLVYLYCPRFVCCISFYHHISSTLSLLRSPFPS